MAGPPGALRPPGCLPSHRIHGQRSAASLIVHSGACRVARAVEAGYLFSLSGLGLACIRGSADLPWAGPACRLDHDTDVLIMVAYARYAAHAVACGAGVACSGGGAGGGERRAARGGRGPR